MKITFIYILSLICICKGHLLSDIVSGAVNTQKQVHKVASSVVGGLSQGLGLNFEAHGGVGHSGFGQRPNNNQRPGNADTVVIVVDQQNNQGQSYPGYRPNEQYSPPGYNHGHGHGHGYYPHENHHKHHAVPPHNHGNQYNHHQPPNYPIPHNNGNYNRPYPNQDFNPTYSNQHNQNNFMTDNPINLNEHTRKPNENNNLTTNKPRPENDNVNSKRPDFNDNTTKKTVDEPLFVPLKPNEYVYEGDKINVNAPKRETNDKPQKNEENEDEYNIDIRFKDE